MNWAWLRHRARRENRRDLHVAQGDRGLRRHRRPWRGNGQRPCSSVARRRAPAAERAGHPLASAGARTSRTSSRRRERAGRPSWCGWSCRAPAASIN